jgi:phage recombination protein Bet
MSGELSVVASMATAHGMNPAEFEAVVRDTCGCKGATPEQFKAFLLVAQEYGLNPVTKEVYAFPTRGGGIQPIVGIDGWLRMANDHEQFDGLETIDRLDEQGNLLAVTAKVYRKDRAHPIEVTEYLGECRQGTEPWKKWPSRMLRHKAVIQGLRYCFGFSGIVDPDEAERMRPVTVEPIAVRPKFDPPRETRAAAIEPPADSSAEAFDKAMACIKRARDTDRLDSLRRTIDDRAGEGVFDPGQVALLTRAILDRAEVIMPREDDAGLDTAAAAEVAP